MLIPSVAWAGIIALVLNLIITPVVKLVSIRLGKIAIPREDRWHNKPTPTLGGIGIYISFIIAVLICVYVFDLNFQLERGILAGSGIIFLVGLYDDLYHLTPPAKLLGQILAAAVVISFGFYTNFFTPKIESPLLAQFPNIILTFIWLVGITNAINLLDNMDGLAAGISLIAALFLSYFFLRSGDIVSLTLSLALGGSLVAFLFHNFPPARLFMGDSGSLFLGFTLAVLAIARQPQASNVFAVMGVPTLLFLLPIMDTTLVTITRLLRGQSPAQGGRDHTSHRLLAFGLSERKTLLVLYGVAIAAGIAGIALETLDYWLSLVFVPILVISLALLAAYLGRLQIVSSVPLAPPGVITRLMLELTYRRRSLEILLDFFVIAIAYYLSFWMVGDFRLSEESFVAYLRTLPLALSASYLSFVLFGIYRGMWRYVGVDDLVRYALAAVVSVAFLSLGAELFTQIPGSIAMILILMAVFLFLGLAASRSSFKIFDQLFGRQSIHNFTDVLVIGAGDAGEMAVRWIIMNPQLGYRPVGFLDRNILNTGSQIHGVRILGGFNSFERIINKKDIKGVIVTIDLSTKDPELEQLITCCKNYGIWVRSLRLEFEMME